MAQLPKEVGVITVDVKPDLSRFVQADVPEIAVLLSDFVDDTKMAPDDVIALAQFIHERYILLPR